jgi:hypothetical protein
VYEALPVSVRAVALPAGIEAGPRTLRFTIPTGDALPGGYGWAIVRVKRSGAVLLSGRLSDGSRISQGTHLQREPSALLHFPFPRGSGEFFGMLDFAAASGESSGTFNWRRPGQVPDSVPLQVEGYLALYEQPARGVRALTYTEPVLDAEFNGDGLAAVVTGAFNVSANDSLTPVANDLRLKVSIDRRNGSFAGSVLFPGFAEPTRFSGVLDQAAQRGFGTFGDSSFNGAVSLVPR